MTEEQQRKVIGQVEEHYSVKIEKSLIVQEEDKLILRLSSSFRDRLINDLISPELGQIVTSEE